MIAQCSGSRCTGARRHPPQQRHTQNLAGRHATSHATAKGGLRCRFQAADFFQVFPCEGGRQEPGNGTLDGRVRNSGTFLELLLSVATARGEFGCFRNSFWESRKRRIMDPRKYRTRRGSWDHDRQQQTRCVMPVGDGLISTDGLHFAGTGVNLRRLKNGDELVECAFHTGHEAGKRMTALLCRRSNSVARNSRMANFARTCKGTDRFRRRERAGSSSVITCSTWDWMASTSITRTSFRESP